MNKEPELLLQQTGDKGERRVTLVAWDTKDHKWQVFKQLGEENARSSLLQRLINHNPETGVVCCSGCSCCC